MPIYSYRCTECDHVTEVFHRTSKSKVPNCPHCDKNGLERILSTFAAQVKGGGFEPCGAPANACGQQTGMCGSGG